MDSKQQIDKEKAAKLREERKKAAEAEKAAKIAKAEAKKEQAQKWRQNPGANTKDLRLKKEFVNETPAGQKKDTSGDLPKGYDPTTVEAAWYEWWSQSNFFSPEYVRPGQSQEEHDAAPPFVMVIPPPNVTGALHIGHALTNSIEDLLARWHRMHGKRVLWVPGTDHAGIATQAVVERKLLRENKTRHDLGREEFVKKVWEWKEQYGGRITSQIKRLGSSVDWSREAFTMDANLTAAVREAFIRFHKQGLIYRSNRLVNWCCQLQTTISDIECDDWDVTEPTFVTCKGHDEKKKYEFGCIWSFLYKIEGSEDFIEVATTRPETMLGDTAVAVHPNDPRYKHLHGKFVEHPFVKRKIPIVTDSILVDMNFGTGAVKITPGHDPNDYECGKRHNLEFINILNPDGTLNEEAGEFQGMMRFDARVAVLQRLTELNLFKSKTKNEMRLKVCSRSGDIIEPYLKPQWWVDLGDLAKKSLAAVESGDLKITPEWKHSSWKLFLENIRPWCISRQLWWGHRIPAYQYWKKGDPQPNLSNDNWITAYSEEEAIEIAKQKLETSDVCVAQDPDVLDTWFSSGLFPFSVMGWPKESSDMEKYYPGQMLETGHDILFFWVARMVMMGLQLTGKLPFSEVLLHGLVRDATGEKMSKSKGNVIDPINVIEGITLEDLHKTLEDGNLKPSDLEIARANQKKFFPRGISECGTDALRFALLAYSNDGRDINLDIKRVEGYRSFCNKIWNAFKLSQMFLGKDYTPQPTCKPTGNESHMDKWILSRLHATLKASHEAFDACDYTKLTISLHSFWLYDVCDVYLEVLKPIMFAKGADADLAAQHGGGATLYTILDAGLKALHPLMPFITEELWQHLPRRSGDLVPSICLASYPQAADFSGNPTLEKEVEAVQNFVRQTRSCFASVNITKKGVTQAQFTTPSGEQKELFLKFKAEILILAYLKDLTFTEETTAPEKWLTQSIDDTCTLFVNPEHAVAPTKKDQKGPSK